MTVAHHSPETTATARWDTAYEYKMVLLLTVAFGLVGLDRWILPPLFASGMGADLHLTNCGFGQPGRSLGHRVGHFRHLHGNLSDRIGRRKVLVPAVVLFSCLSVFTGFATSLTSLLLIRAIMGVSEGAVAPVGVAVAVEASHPRRRGMNNGLFQCAFALFGLAIAPIAATQLLQFMSWRSVFALVGVPGVIVAVLIWFVLREPATVKKAVDAPRAPFSAIFKHRNVLLAMLALLCAMTGIFVLSAMMPSYLTEVLKLTPQQMGFVTSALGFGGFLGQFGVPAISDFLGRRRSTVITFSVAAIFLWLFVHTVPTFAAALCPAIHRLVLQSRRALRHCRPIAAEAAPLGMISTVAGLIIGAGEIFGGGVGAGDRGRNRQRLRAQVHPVSGDGRPDIGHRHFAVFQRNRSALHPVIVLGGGVGARSIRREASRRHRPVAHRRAGADPWGSALWCFTAQPDACASCPRRNPGPPRNKARD